MTYLFDAMSKLTPVAQEGVLWVCALVVVAMAAVTFAGMVFLADIVCRGQKDKQEAEDDKRQKKHEVDLKYGRPENRQSVTEQYFQHLNKPTLGERLLGKHFDEDYVGEQKDPPPHTIYEEDDVS